MSETLAALIRSICCAAVVACSASAGYLWLYDQCVRMPRVSLRSWAWPDYAVGLPTATNRGTVREADYRLPRQAAEIFFYPAFQIDRQIHPTKWADEHPSQMFHRAAEQVDECRRIGR
jgi:hypothetical protein